MTKLSKAAFLSKYASIFADNVTRDISEEDVRDFRQDISDSFLSIDDNFVDEDSFTSDSATKAPSQQSVKAYVDGKALGQSKFIWYQDTIDNGTELTPLDTTSDRDIFSAWPDNDEFVVAFITLTIIAVQEPGSGDYSYTAEKKFTFGRMSGTVTKRGDMAVYELRDADGDIESIDADLSVDSGNVRLTLTTPESGGVYQSKWKWKVIAEITYENYLYEV